MFFWDSTMLLILPALALSIWAQMRVRRAYGAWSEIGSRRRITGAELSRKIISANGLDVHVSPTPGTLTDHYDPTSNTLRLSDGVHDSFSIAAIGIAAHECGHALQHAQSYAPLKLRSFMAPVASVASFAAVPLFLLGLFFGMGQLVQIGIICFAGIVAFHVITLPVEFDASRRALKTIQEMSILTPEELIGAKEVLNAAALTYVAAAIMSILQLLRLLLIARGRD